jgi:prepilin-type N-terminal cleavage/methylation domain-containing protein
MDIHNVPPPPSYKLNGFTLVEISIVMIIIGLLIGGVFGGLKLVENMQVNKTIQDLKSIESAALTFKDTYGRLPGDITNPSTRLPNCSTAPCSTGGNGNRRLDATAWNEALTATMEKFTFWNHLQAADLSSLGVKNTTDLNFGEGQPESPLQGGYRLTRYNGVFAVAGTRPFSETVLFVTQQSSAILNGGSWTMPCVPIASIDRKIDDGFVYDGFFQGWNCGTVVVSSPYNLSSNGAIMYDLKGF